MSIIVKVAKLGGIVKETMLEDNATVTDALEATDNSDDSSYQEVKVNGRSQTDDFKLKNGDIVTLAPKVKGGLK